MLNYMQVEKQKIFDVTFKEVQQLWNISADAANKRLTVIRKALGKKRFHKLTVTQFCQAEDISTDEFYNKITVT